MKYGCRAHDYGCFTAQELARTLADQGYNAAQLAMPKAIRGIADMNGISPEQLEEIRTAFAGADVEITVLSCYRDLSSPDDGTRTAAVFVHALDTVEKLRTLKETVGDGAHFHVIFDPVNVLTAENVDNQDALWPAWCEVIGKDLAAVHVKDAVLHPDAPRTPTALGSGQMDYTVIREWLHRGHPTAALLRDEVILPVAQEDLAYMRTL